MASRADKQRVLAGSLALLPPGDKLNPGDSLMLSNWRVDQEGQLRSRRGTTRTATLGAPITSLFRVDVDRYAGAGTSLYKGTTLGTTLSGGFDGVYPINMVPYQGYVWAMNRSKQAKVKGTTVYNMGIAAPVAAAVATAGSLTNTLLDDIEDNTHDWNVYDGNGVPVPSETEALQVGTIAVTMGSPDVVGTGTNFTTDLIGVEIDIIGVVAGITYQVTPYKIIAVADDTHMTLDGPWPAMGVVDVPDANWYIITRIVYTDQTINKSGSSGLRFSAQSAGTYVVQGNPASPYDTSVGGAVNPWDQMTLWFYVGDWTQVDQMTIYLIDSNNVGVTAYVNGKGLSNGWNQLALSRVYDTTKFLLADPTYQAALQQYQDAVAAAGPSGISSQVYALSIQLDAIAQGLLSQYPDGNGFTPGTTLTSTADFDWTSVSRVLFMVSLLGPVVLEFNQLQFVGGPHGLISGDVSYYYTYVNADGHESNPSPPVDVTVSGQAVTLSVLADSGDAQVTKKNIYRIGGGLTEAQLVDSVNTGTTTYLDFVTNDAIQNNHIVLQIDYDPPPAAKGMLGPYGGKLVAWASAANPSRLWWTLTSKPWAWPGAADSFVGSWEDVGEDGEEIIGCTQHAQSLWIYKRRSIWRVDGNLDSAAAVPRRITNQHGLIGESALIPVGPVDYFVGAEGVFLSNGDSVIEVSRAIRPLFRGDFVPVRFGVAWAPINQAAIQACVLGFINGRLYFSYPEGSATVPSKTLVLDVVSGRWAEHDGGFSAFHYEGQGDFLIAGGQSDNGLYEMETGSTDNGAALAVDWQSAFLDQGLPNNPKVYSDVVIELQTEIGGAGPAETLSIALIPESGTAAAISLGTITASDRATKTLTIPGGLEAKNVAIQISGSVLKTVIVYGVWIHYYALERGALSFDSGPMDCASDGRLCDVDQLELTLRSTGTITWTLYTDYNGAMASRATGTIATTGRTSFQIPVTAVRGIQFQLKLTATSEFSLYAARVRLQPLGEIIPFTSTILPLG